MQIGPAKEAWRSGGGGGATSTHACADDAPPPVSAPQAGVSHEGSINNEASVWRVSGLCSQDRRDTRGRTQRLRPATPRTPIMGGVTPLLTASTNTPHAHFLPNWQTVIQRGVHACAYANAPGSEPARSPQSSVRRQKMRFINKRTAPGFNKGEAELSPRASSGVTDTRGAFIQLVS